MMYDLETRLSSYFTDLLHSALTRAPLGGGGYFEPPLVFLRYLLN